MKELWQNISDKLSRPKKVMGVSVVRTDKEEYDLFFTVAVYKKGFLEIETFGNGIDELKKYLKNSFFTLPCYLTVSGKDVLIKSETKIGGEAPRQSIPGISEEEFYRDDLSNDTVRYSAFARRGVIDEIVENLTEEGILISEVFLGCKTAFQELDLTGISSEVPAYPYAVDLKTGNVKFDESIRSDSFRFQDRVVGSEFLLSLFSAFAFAFNTEGILFDQYEHSKEELYYGMIFKRVMLYSAGLCFLLTTVFYFYNNSVNEKLSIERQKLQILKTEQKEIIERAEMERRVAQLMGDVYKPIRYSVYFDRLGLSIPRVVSLNRLLLAPLETSNVKSRDPLKFKNNVMTISGETASSSAINEWVDRLYEFDWIENIVINDYRPSKEYDDLYSFKLEIKVNFN